MPQLEEIVLRISRRTSFMGKARILDRMGLGPSRKDLVPPGVDSVDCIEGIRMFSTHPTDIMFRELYVNGLYQDDVLAALRSLLRPGDVFWDVGANYGFMSLYVDRIFTGAVATISFEPSPIVLPELHRNLELNGAHSVRVEEICLSDRTGRVRFYTSDDHSWNATMIPEYAVAQNEPTEIEVDSSTIDECVKRLPPPSVIKIDVEGAEHLVVRGGERFLRETRVPVIVEYNVFAIRQAGATPEQYLEGFRDLGYQPCAMRRPYIGSHRWRTLHTIVSPQDLQPICNLILLDARSQAGAGDDRSSSAPTDHYKPKDVSLRLEGIRSSGNSLHG